MKFAKQQIKIQFCSMQIQNSLPIGASVPALGLSNKAVFDGEYYFYILVVKRFHWVLWFFPLLKNQFFQVTTRS